MTPAPILAIVAGPVGRGTSALEFLRLTTALVAHGQPVRLVVLGPGLDVLQSDDLDAEIERHLEAVAAFGVIPDPIDESALPAALAGATSVLRYGDPARPGSPGLLEADAGTRRRALLEAGQVIARRQRADA